MKAKPIAAVLATVALALTGVVGLGVAAASAHTPSESITCTAAKVDLVSYDSGATASVTLDGTSVHTGTFNGTYHFSQALTSDASHTSHRLQVVVVSKDGNQYNVNYDQTATGCYTPPPPTKDAAFTVSVQPATCGVDGKLVYGAQSHISGITGTADGAHGPADYSVTATAADTHLFASGDPTLTLTGHIDGAKAYQSNDPSADCYQAPPPQPCVASGAPYTEDAAPIQTETGLEYKGGSGKPVNWLFPATGNLQGITSQSYTIASATGYHAALRFVLYSNGTTGYTSVSAEPYENGWAPGQTGTFTVTQDTLVWNSHIAAGPGSIGDPIKLSAMATLIPKNQLISIGNHLGSSAPADAETTVSSMAGCVTAKFTPGDKPAPIVEVTHHSTTDCDSATVTEYTDTTTTGYVYDAGTNTYIKGEPVTVETSTSRDATHLECPLPKPDPIITVASHTTTDCSAKEDTTTTTTTTTDYVQDDSGDWVLGLPVVTTAVTHSKATEKECPTTVVHHSSTPPAKVLGFTGTDDGNALWYALGLLGLGLIALAVKLLRRRTA